MVRYYAAAVIAALGLLVVARTDGAAQGDKWGTVKGKVVWGGAKVPERTEIKVTVDQAHCLAKGKLLDEDLVVNAKNKGVKWVIVWLAADAEGGAPPIHPSLKDPKNKKVELDQPMCMFMPRAMAIQQGQDVHVKNSAPVNHNIQWVGDGVNNEGGNVTLPPGKEYTIKDLQAQPLPLTMRCNVHPWMSGRLAVFAHPYYAITDEDGNFEIKMAPAGKYRIIAWQEKVGYRNGREGKAGQEIEIKGGGTTDLGELKIGK